MTDANMEARGTQTYEMRLEHLIVSGRKQRGAVREAGAHSAGVSQRAMGAHCKKTSPLRLKLKPSKTKQTE